MTSQVSQEVEKVTRENDQLRQEVKDLQEHLSEVLSVQGSDRIQALKEEVKDVWVQVFPFSCFISRLSYCIFCFSLCRSILHIRIQ